MAAPARMTSKCTRAPRPRGNIGAFRLYRTKPQRSWCRPRDRTSAPGPPVHRSGMERAALQPDRPGFLAEPAVVARCDHRDRRGEQAPRGRSEEHTSELQSLMRISYAVFCLIKKKIK